jgi:hypothetical protein
MCDMCTGAEAFWSYLVMDIYQELNVIDRFEERFGNRDSVRRACDFMVSYLAGMQRPLPEIAAEGLRAAIKYKEGSALASELGSARRSISDFLREPSARTNYGTPEYCMARALEAVLISYQNPTWGGGASELVSNFLDMTETFESNHELMKRLLEEYFSL